MSIKTCIYLVKKYLKSKPLIYKILLFIKHQGKHFITIPQIFFFVLKQKKINPFLIDKLSYDIPNLYTNENYTPNDFYYHAYHLKRFSGISPFHSLNLSIEHGVYFSNYVWTSDLEHAESKIITIGKNRQEIINKLTNKKVVNIGPYIYYVTGFYSEKQLSRLKQKLGRTLLVFPSHSTHWINSAYDIEYFAAEIKKYAAEYNTVLVCVYWKDILNGHHKYYIKNNFTCVSAGHIYDPFFLPRLKSLISLADMTMSNVIGTHLGYCIFLNKPHYLFSQDIKFNNTLPALEADTYDRLNKIKMDPAITKMYQLFSNYSEEITESQKAIVRTYWGTDDIKTKDQLKQILKA